MSKRTIGLILIVLGAIWTGISLAADVIGLGTDRTGIYWAQQLGAAAGLIVVGIGVWLVLRKPAKK
jgi:hypothetical protein